MRKARRKVHFRGTWYGVAMGWAECATHVEPFAKNLTIESHEVTCLRCLKALKAKGKKR